MNKLALLSSSKLPAFIREEYPALVSFIEAYYRYLETQETIQNAGDIDETITKYVNMYRSELARGFGTPNQVSVVEFIRHNKEFFSRKGTPDAFRYFFRTFFNEEISISNPNYLIASGGEISSHYFFYATIIAGEIFVGDTLVLSHGARTYGLVIDKIEQLDQTTVELYFVPTRAMFGANSHQSLLSHDVFECRVFDTQGNTTFYGMTKEPMTRIVVQTPGKYWQYGQVITFPSSDVNGTDTVARVSRLLPGGGIGSIEIIEHGYPHIPGQLYTISPYSTRPVSTGSYSVEVTQESPQILHHTLSISDAVDSFAETITGLRQPGDYFLESYVDITYAAGIGFAYESAVSGTPQTETVTDVSYQAWLDSRATLTLEFGSMTRHRPVYLSEKSLISNQNCKLHDSLYYQAHSYVIETTTNIQDYRGSLDLIHPAGLKFFAQLNKTFEADLSSSISLIE